MTADTLAQFSVNCLLGPPPVTSCSRGRGIIFVMATEKRNRALEIFFGAVLYSTVAWLGLEMALVSRQVSVVWPASGVALALLVFRGRRLWPAIALGAFVVNMSTGAPIVAAVGVAIGNTVEALAGATILFSLRFSPSLKRVRDVGALFLVTATLTPLLGATIGVLSLCIANVEPWSRFQVLWSLWWTGDAIGDLVVSPFLFVWTAQARRGWQLQRVGETTALAIGLLILSLIVFVKPSNGPPFPVHYLIFPAVIWSALRLGQHSTATLVLGAATVTTLATLGGRGPFVDEPMNTSLLDVELFMAVVSVTGLFLGAATAERNRAERQRTEDFVQLRESRERLASAARALAEADRRKDEFLAVLGHELRNPLAPLQNSVELLAHRATDPRVVAQARVIMERQLKHLVRLVDDLLDVSRIRSGKIAMAKQRMELGVAIENAVEISRPLIDSRKHKLTVSVPAEPIYVDADPIRLPQLLSNLLNNAAKYTNEGGDVFIGAEQNDNTAIATVKDNGIGMTPVELTEVFELFAQAGGRVDHAVQGGLGVGLSLAKSLAVLHGGSLDARSEGPGTGTEFTLMLPLAAPPPPVSDDLSGLIAPLAASLSMEPVRPLKILVVDDNVDAAESLGFLLNDVGYEVRTAHGGVEAVNVAKQYFPQVMILDLGMPEMDGYAVAKAIREDHALTNTRLIALSGYGQPEDRRRTAEAGFEAHLIKPVEPEKLFAELRKEEAFAETLSRLT
jgi:signal transduction histidine kinase/ActR/RegA family two-component response regulator